MEMQQISESSEPAAEYTQIEQENSCRVHVTGTPDPDHGRLAEKELEEEEGDSRMQEEQALILKKKKKMQEEELNDLVEKKRLKLAARMKRSHELKAECVQTLKNLGFSASEDRVVHKKMEGQVKQFEHWGDVSAKKLTNAQDEICTRGDLIIFAHVFVTYLILIGLGAVFGGSTTKNVIIVKLIISLIILSVINISMLYNCHKQIKYWLKLRARTKKLFMKVKNERSNLVYVPSSHPDADENADIKIDLACISVARPWESMSVLSVVGILLMSIAMSLMEFLQLWCVWDELTVHW